ncbi:membrane protein [Clostridia bacterium]|nr:membrane protein [Clostridia bacterium]
MINVIAIVIGGSLGVLLRGMTPKRLRDPVVMGLGLCVILIGLSDAIKTQDTLGVIICMAVGVITGSIIQIERKLNSFGDKLKDKLSSSDSDNTFAQGFVTASLVYCVGALAVVGSLESGLSGDHSTLIAKSLIDGISSIFFASTLGAGVILSAVPILIYEGTITLLAGWLAPILSTDIIREMSAVGGLLVAAIGLNLTGSGKFPIGDMLPATFIPMLYIPIVGLIK